MATATRKKKTVDDLKADLAAAKAKVAALEQKAYKSELSELISKSHFAADYKAIQAAFKDVSDVAILMEIAAACGAKRIHITQTEPKPRASKPKVAGAAKTTAARKTAVKKSIK
jgi:hypothetical protein